MVQVYNDKKNRDQRPECDYGFKLIIIGDAGAGKSSFMHQFLEGKFRKQSTHTIGVEFGTKIISLGNRQIKLQIWDTAGQEDYDRLRPLSYPQTDVFLVCFSVVSNPSFKNVKLKWIPEINHHAPGVPIILVGTKSDLRNDAETQAQLRAKNLTMVAQGEIEQMVNEVNAVKYIECSALTQEGLKSVFDEAIRAALYKPSSKKKGGCTLL